MAAKKNTVKAARSKDAQGNARNTVDVEKLRSPKGDTLQFENSRRAQMLVIFWEGSIDVALAAPQVPSPLFVVGQSTILLVPPATPGTGSGIPKDNPGVSAELTLTEALPNRFCSRHYDITFVNDYNPVDLSLGASGAGQDPEIIIGSEDPPLRTDDRSRVSGWSRLRRRHAPRRAPA